jgi:hypothetical protein
MKILFALSLFCLFVTPDSPLCQEEEPVDSLLIGLPCVAVWVDSLAPALEEKGIHQAALNDTITYCLRHAGIEVVDADTIQAVPGAPILVLHLEALLQAGIDQVCYSIRLELAQTVCLERDESIVAGRVPTWGQSSIGLYASGWRDELIKDVIAHTEAFRDAFLAANTPFGDTR